MVLKKLKAVIKSNKLVTFEYNGLPRVVEPHLIGITESGKYVLKAFETWPFDSKDRPKWKFFSLSNVKNLIIMSKSFETKRDFEKNELYVEKVILQI